MRRCRVHCAAPPWGNHAATLTRTSNGAGNRIGGIDSWRAFEWHDPEGSIFLCIDTINHME